MDRWIDRFDTVKTLENGLRFKDILLDTRLIFSIPTLLPNTPFPLFANPHFHSLSAFTSQQSFILYHSSTSLFLLSISLHRLLFIPLPFSLLVVTTFFPSFFTYPLPHGKWHRIPLCVGKANLFITTIYLCFYEPHATMKDIHTSTV